MALDGKDWGALSADGRAPYRALLDLAPPPAFINIDVEGQSADIFLDLLNRASPACWCVEHDVRADEMVSRAAHYKYREVLRNGTNLVFAR